MRLAAAALSLLLLPSAAAAETVTVGSGDLRAQVETEPWALRFVDADGREVAAESPARRIGYRAAAGWTGATRATSVSRDGDALVAEVETAATTPLGSMPGDRMRVRIAPAGAGVMTVVAEPLGGADKSALGIGFASTALEHFLGLGERPAAVDQRGADRLETYVADGPYYPDPAERAVLSAFVPPQGYRERDDATYFPIPWMLSSQGYGVLVENDETAYHDFGANRDWAVEVTSAPDDPGADPHAPESLRLRVFGGGTPARVLRRYTAYVGRQPAPAAPWVWGAWFQPGGTLEEQLGQVDRLRKADAPLSVTQTYLHYLPCGAHVGGRPEERKRVDAFHARGAAVTTYFNPMICTDYQPRYDEAVAAGALATHADGSPYTYPYSTPSSRFDVAQFDFSGGAGRAFYAKLLAEAVADGHDGWMEDFGEYTPLDSHYANGMDGTRMHNLYPTQYHCAAYDFVRAQKRPIVRFQRSGFTGAPRCAQVVWSGDPTVAWDFDGLASQVKAGLSMGLSGVSTWGSDIGGFFALGEHSLTDELLKRWVQFGAVSPVMRMQRNGGALPPKERPQVEEDDQIANWRRYAKLHTRLYPYLEAAAAVYRKTGLPIMRHLALAYPTDERSGERDDEYLFGPDLLAAPVIEPGVTQRDLYLPPGEWVDFWRALRYREKPGDLRLGRARVLAGRREATIPAPLEELPLLVRAGAVLPLLPADVDTLAPYGPGADAVPLSRRRGRLDLIAFPRGRWSGTFHRGERIASRVRPGRWDLTIRGKRRRTYSLQASLATLRRPFRPCSVTVGGQRARFRFDRRTRVLRVPVRMRSGVVSARRSCR